MDELAVNRWAGKSAEDVLTESYHEIRGPIYNAVGFLNVLKSVNQLSSEEVQQYIELSLNYVLQAQDIVKSVYDYMNENRSDQ
jgi:hypothetical protein